MIKKLSAFLLVLAGCLWGIIAIFINKLKTFGFDSYEIGFIRISLCTAGMFIFLLIYDKKLLKIKLKDIWIFMGSGIVSVTFFSACYFRTVLDVEAGIAAALLYTSPAFIIIFSAILFKEKINTKKIAAIILTVIGCALVSGIVGTDVKLDAVKVIIGIGSGLFYALYSIFGVYAAKKNYTTLTITFYTFLFATVGFLTVANPINIVKITVSHPIALPYELAIALLCGFLPYFFYTTGLRNTEPSFAGVLVATEPLVACIVGILFLGDSIHYSKLMGIALVLGSIMLLNLKAKNKT